MSSLASDVYGMLKDEASKTLQRVEISSAILPTMVVDLAKKSPGARASPGDSKGTPGSSKAKEGVLRRLQPVVTVKSTAGDVTVAPGGRPAVPGGKFPLLLASAVGVLALAVSSTSVVIGQGRKGLVVVSASGLLALGVYAYQMRKLGVKRRAR